MKVMALVSPVPEEPLRVAVIELAGMAVLTKAEVGAETLSLGDAAATIVSDIPVPQGDAAALLFVAPVRGVPPIVSGGARGVSGVRVYVAFPDTVPSRRGSHQRYRYWVRFPDRKR